MKTAHVVVVLVLNLIFWLQSIQPGADASLAFLSFVGVVLAAAVLLHKSILIFFIKKR